jgi:hypothetical protein
MARQAMNQDLPVWQISVHAYQAKGVHQPWIAEIAPSQYAGLGKRARADYDAKRAREWDASADYKSAYAAECLAAVDADPMILTHPACHTDAREAIYYARARRDKDQHKELVRAASEENSLPDPSEVRAGDRVYHLLSGQYLHVVKVNRQTLHCVTSAGAQYKAKVRACQWLHYNELQAAVVARAPIRPERFPIRYLDIA